MTFMKSLFAAGLMVGLASGAAFGSLTLKATRLSPSDADFKSIYGGGTPFGGELSFGLGKNLEFWIGASSFSKKGKTTYTREETSLSLLPISGGLKVKLLPGKAICPYLAAGAEYVMFKETSPIGDASANGIGWIGKAGVTIRAARFLGFDVHGAYSSCSIKTADFTFNVGGLELGGGIVIIF